MNKLDKKEIIRQLVQYYSGGSNADFARKLGITPQGLSTWLKRNSFDIELVFAKCENLSAEWLLTGEGQMLKDNKPERSDSDSAVNIYKELLADKERQIAELNKEVGKLTERLSNFHQGEREETDPIGLSGGDYPILDPQTGDNVSPMPGVSQATPIGTNELKPGTRATK